MSHPTKIHDLASNGLEALYFDNPSEQAIQVNRTPDDTDTLCLVGRRGQDGRVKSFTAINYGDYDENGDSKRLEEIKLNLQQTLDMKQTGDYSIILNNVTLSKEEQELLHWLVSSLEVE